MLRVLLDCNEEVGPSRRYPNLARLKLYRDLYRDRKVQNRPVTH